MNRLKRVLAVLLAAVLCAGCVSAAAEEDSWTCPDCGTGNTTNFCIRCGAKKPDMIACPGCGEKYPIDTEAVFCGKCGTKLRPEAEPSERMEGDGFDTPEEAVLYYLEGLKNLDFGQMLRAFAWETQAEHYAVDENLRRISAYLPSIKPRLPGDSEFIRTANLYSLRTVQIDAIYQAMEYCLLQDHYSDLNSAYGTKSAKDGTFDAFMEEFNNGRLDKLAGMTNIRFLTPDRVTDGRFSSEKTQKNYARNNAVYGADETVDVPAVADVGDEILFCCPTVARYGEKWYLVSVRSVTGMIIGIDSVSQAFVCGKGSLGDYLP